MKKYKELSKRLSKIEKHLGLNTEVKLASQANPEEHSFEWLKPELTEIPEKWCVCRDYKTALVINDWFNTLKKPTTLFTTDKGYVCSDKSALEFKIPEGYTEITFDQFNKWVLKEDEKPLSIREVQVKVTSQEEANECAEIAKACGEKIGNLFSKNYDIIRNYFSYNYTGANYFGFYSKDLLQKEISIQEYIERFGKSTEIDWSKSGYFKFTNDLNPNDEIYCISQPENWGLENDSMRVIILSESQDKDRLGNTNFVLKSHLKQCTEPITLSND